MSAGAQNDGIMQPAGSIGPGHITSVVAHKSGGGGGGQFGGFSGTDGFGVALRALTRLLDYVGIGYRLTSYKDMNR